MAIIVEDGSIVTNANSYVSEAELTSFAADRGITLTADEDELLIKAMDYIESLDFQGIKVSRDQPLQWPRAYVTIDQYYFPSNEIPKELKNGLMQVAIAIDQDMNPLDPLEQTVKREKVDVIEVEYMDGSTSQAIARTITSSLYKLLNGGGTGGNIIRVNKA